MPKNGQAGNLKISRTDLESHTDAYLLTTAVCREPTLMSQAALLKFSGITLKKSYNLYPIIISEPIILEAEGPGMPLLYPCHNLAHKFTLLTFCELSKW